MGLLAEKFQFQVVLLKLPRTFDSVHKQKIHSRDWLTGWRRCRSMSFELKLLQVKCSNAWMKSTASGCFKTTNLHLQTDDLNYLENTLPETNIAPKNDGFQ